MSIIPRLTINFFFINVFGKLGTTIHVMMRTKLNSIYFTNDPNRSKTEILVIERFQVVHNMWQKLWWPYLIGIMCNMYIDLS